MKTILIILITSLFWAAGIWIDRNYSDVIKAEIRAWVQEEVVDDVKEEVTEVKESVAEVKSVVAPKKPAPALKVEQPKAPAKNYAELICGYWEPVEGTTSKLDISKYGTVTRYYKLRADSSIWYDDRYEYAISGNKLVVNDYYKCTVNVFKENGVTYLEIYGHENYAGKYRLRK